MQLEAQPKPLREEEVSPKTALRSPAACGGVLVLLRMFQLARGRCVEMDPTKSATDNLNGDIEPPERE